MLSSLSGPPAASGETYHPSRLRGTKRHARVRDGPTRTGAGLTGGKPRPKASAGIPHLRSTNGYASAPLALSRAPRAERPTGPEGRFSYSAATAPSLIRRFAPPFSRRRGEGNARRSCLFRRIAPARRAQLSLSPRTALGEGTRHVGGASAPSSYVHSDIGIDRRRSRWRVGWACDRPFSASRVWGVAAYVARALSALCHCDASSPARYVAISR